MSDQSTTHDDAENNKIWWESQLQDIDFSILPEPVPTSTIPKEKMANASAPVSTPNRAALPAMLTNLLKDIQRQPETYAVGFFICRLTNGDYRVVFPRTYDRKTLLALADAVQRFSHLLREDNQ